MQNKTLKELCAEAENCDSLSMKRALIEEIEARGEKYLSDLYNAGDKIGNLDKIFHRTEYLPEESFLRYRGSDENEVTFKCLHYWSSSNSDCDFFTIPFGEVENFDIAKAENYSIERARKNLKKEIQRAADLLKSAQAELDEFEKQYPEA